MSDESAAAHTQSCPRCRITVTAERGASCPRCKGALAPGGSSERTISPLMLFGMPIAMLVAVVALIVTLSRKDAGPEGEALMGIDFTAAEPLPDGSWLARGGPLTPSTVPDRMSVSLSGGKCARIAWRARLVVDAGTGPGDLSGEYDCKAASTVYSPKLAFAAGQWMTFEMRLDPVGGPIEQSPAISMVLLAAP